MTALVTVEKLDAHIAVVTLNRAERLNALNRTLITELNTQLSAITKDPSVRCLLLRGAGEKAFAAGADIAEMKSFGPEEARAFCELGHATFDLLSNAAFPTIAVVHGFALGGGCELALSCDFIFAAEDAKFGQPEVKLGLIPGFGGTQRLSRRVPLAKAKELVFGGATIDAVEAYRIGLANQLWPRAELWDKALAFAQQVSAMAPLAIASAKRAMNEGYELPLEQASSLERKHFSQAFATSDVQEGIQAFLEKRAPTFRGA